MTKNGYLKQEAADREVPMPQPDFKVSWSLLDALQDLIENFGGVGGSPRPAGSRPGGVTS